MYARIRVVIRKRFYEQQRAYSHSESVIHFSVSKKQLFAQLTVFLLTIKATLSVRKRMRNFYNCSHAW